MPSCLGIEIDLRASFGFERLPEYPYLPDDATGDTTPTTISVIVPYCPTSQFMIRYVTPVPDPPTHFYYFKLFLNGKHTVSWGCGQENSFCGVVLYGLFGDKDGVERRALCFPKAAAPVKNKKMGGADERVLEIRAFRAKERRRVPKQTEKWDSGTPGKKGSANIEMMRAGCLQKYDPQRYFKYALIDPVDKPFVTFKYYYRTEEELRSPNPDGSAPVSTYSSPAKSGRSSDLLSWSGRHALDLNDTEASTFQSFLARPAPPLPVIPRRLPTPPMAHYASPDKARRVLGMDIKANDKDLRAEATHLRARSQLDLTSLNNSPSPSPRRKRENSVGVLRDIVACATRRRGSSPRAQGEDAASAA